MYGLGTVINVGAIILGGLLGILFGRFIKERHKDTLCKACGLAVIFIGTAGALKGMFSVVDGKIVYGGDFLIIGCLALGAIIGEIINIEGGFERFGEWLKKKTKSTKDNKFVEGFVSASIPLLSSNQFGFKGKIDCYSASKSLADFLIAYTFFPCLPTYFPL